MGIATSTAGIGFGDVLPDTGYVYVGFVVAYLAIGMALFLSFVIVAQQSITSYVDQIFETLKGNLKKIKKT